MFDVFWWETHISYWRMSVVCPSYVRRMSVVCPSYVRRMSVVCLVGNWHMILAYINRITTVCPRQFFDACRCMFVVCPSYVHRMFAVFQPTIRLIFTVCPPYIRHITSACPPYLISHFPKNIFPNVANMVVQANYVLVMHKTYTNFMYKKPPKLHN